MGGVCSAPFPSYGVHVSVSKHVNRAKTAESIEMPFVQQTRVCPRNHALVDGAYWCHLANTIKCLAAEGIGSTRVVAAPICLLAAVERRINFFLPNDKCFPQSPCNTIRSFVKIL